jgi:plastocyanin
MKCEHIFREFANRGIDPFGLGPEGEDEEGEEGEEESFVSSTPDPIEVSLLIGDEFAFTPDTIEAETGRPLRLLVENTSEEHHNFTIDTIPCEIAVCDGDPSEADHPQFFDVHLALDGGSTGTIEFTPLEAGTYPFYCTGEETEPDGMRGELVVR